MIDELTAAAKQTGLELIDMSGTAPVDPRLDEIDDCLYRVAVRVLIVQNSRVLLVKENEEWWAFPGGGVDHGETIQASLTREIEEELGVPAGKVSSDFQIAYYNIGTVVQGIPRANLYYKVSVSAELLTQIDQVTEWAWFTKDEFLQSDLNPSYNKVELAHVIFGA